MTSQMKFERVYETEYFKSVWRYDYSVTKSGPVSVSTTYKFDPTKKETLKDMVPQKKSRKK